MKKVSKKAKVITRFAPSPTGLFHIGSARTALFNYLFAKNKGGQFILRIEDTDKERSKPEFEKDIIDSLDWLGIKCDIGPVRQSERIEIYKKYLVIRFRTPVRKVKFKDLIRGEIEFDGSLIGDFVIAKDLVTPLYNFTVVVDDYEMAVSHIIRGEDLLPNTPKQIFLEEALGFPKPQFAHLPLILGPDRSKLSKRHGATSVSEYRQKGYLPEVIINFISFLGWNPGTDKEVYSLTELEQDFSLENISKGGAIFNVKRLDYLNGLYIRQKPLKELTELCIPFLVEKNLIKPDISRGELDEISKMISLYHERLKYISEIPDLIDFFLKDKLEYQKEMLIWKDATNRETEHIIDKLINILSDIEVGEWNKGNLENILLGQAEEVSL
ncbi:MAG: glutamate--tRNA ligase family protein, partial [Candidatus Nealsonbacteria bacterium]|nr:glutamate--tRNA ligase family protein [Candidatus Nealsonbacteria bacterium]